jgi:hypothetical protein
MGSNPENGVMSPNENQNFERILESAIVVCWADLMRGAPKGLIHIEYDLAPNGTLDDLQIWSCLDRGHWLLACEYWTSPSKFHGHGVHFQNGYQSRDLAHILESMMEHQTAFLLPAYVGRQDCCRYQHRPKKNARMPARSYAKLLTNSSQCSTNPLVP